MNLYKRSYSMKRLIFLCLLFIPAYLTLNTYQSMVMAKTRSIRVKARTPDGKTKEINLYSGYHALVVGCGDYTKGWPRLPNPVRDAMEVSTGLEKIGFEVKFVENPDGRALRRAFNDLVSGAGSDPKKAIFVYYAGHGHTLSRADGTKLGYIVPVNAPDPEKDLSGFMTAAVSMREIEEISTLIKAKHVLMAFDSCFSGAIFRASSGTPSHYIREQAAKPVRAFITAGEENERVPDESVFKTCFMQGLFESYADRNKDGYVTGEEIGLYLKEQVVNYTGGAQHPRFGKVNNPLLDKGDFVFALGKPAPGPVPPSTPSLEAEKKRLEEERKKIESERRELEQLKALAEERKKLEAERTRLEAEKKKLATIKRPEKIKGDLPEQGKVWRDPVTGMEFVRVPGGCFEMGSPSGEEGRHSNEGPVHEVCVDEFWMGKFEVTNAQYRQFRSVHNSKDYKGNSLNGDNQPAVYVSWEDAKAFAKWLSEKSGGRYQFRLPTEAEWEYACRAGTSTARYWGDDPDDACGYANVHDQTSKRVNKFDWSHHECDDGYAVTAPVGSFKPNAFGLYDMLGNIWEWCEDIYSGDAYSKHQRNNPIYVDGGSYRVIRGGSWSDGPGYVRSANRGGNSPGGRHDDLGFRLLRTP